MVKKPAWSWSVGMVNLAVKTRCFMARHHPTNIESPFTKMIRVTKPTLQPKLNHMFKTRERGIIWLSVSLGSPPDTSAVARSWFGRQFRSAFHASLQKRGFDKEGRRLVMDSNGEVIGKRKPGITCTLQIILKPPIKTAKWEELVQETELLVRELEKRQAPPLAGKSISDSNTRKR